MLKATGLLFCLGLIAAMFMVSFTEVSDTPEQDYILGHRKLALDEMAAHGIPASIILAQALVESDAGQSVLAKRANNHFGIKCKSWWTGGTYFYADDDRDLQGRLTASCFRRYDSVGASFTDHSEFLRFSGRYDALFTYGVTDYVSWANGLQRCGYATDPRYAQRLIQVIEKYQLQNLDRQD